MVRHMAACLVAGPDAIVSHSTAARLSELDGLGPRRDGAVHLTRTAGTGHQRPGIAQHWADLPPHAWTDIDGIRCTAIAHTVADVGRSGDRLTTICLMESAMRKGVVVNDVLSAAAGRPGSARLPTWLARADPRSANRLEPRSGST